MMTTEEYVAIMAGARHRTRADQEALRQLTDYQPMGRHTRQRLYTAQDRLGQAVDALEEALDMFDPEWDEPKVSASGPIDLAKTPEFAIEEGRYGVCVCSAGADEPEPDCPRHQILRHRPAHQGRMIKDRPQA